MSERMFRAILGVSLLILLGLGWEEGIYAYMGLLLFEGITNWRIPIIISRSRYKDNYPQHVNQCGAIQAKIPFDAERMLRVVIFTFLVISYVLYKDLLWWFPWFIGIMLCIAGLTGICPMVMMLRASGFR
jgi:hypothetical protein